MTLPWTEEDPPEVVDTLRTLIVAGCEPSPELARQIRGLVAELAARRRCWCGRPAATSSPCGCCCAEHDAALTVARVRALITEHPDSEVPVIALDDLRRALGDQ